jgi:hypothetical protein
MAVVSVHNQKMTKVMTEMGNGKESKIARLRTPSLTEHKGSLTREVFGGENSFSRTKHEAGRLLRTNRDVSCVHTRKSLIMPSKLTLQVCLYPRRFVIVPREKREELVATLDDLAKRLMKMINSNRTKTSVRLRAMQVFAELIRTSYTMVRDAEVEELERETETLEKEKEHAKTEETARKEPTEPA